MEIMAAAVQDNDSRWCSKAAAKDPPAGCIYVDAYSGYPASLVSEAPANGKSTEMEKSRLAAQASPRKDEKEFK